MHYTGDFVMGWKRRRGCRADKRKAKYSYKSICDAAIQLVSSARKTRKCKYKQTSHIPVLRHGKYSSHNVRTDNGKSNQTYHCQYIGFTQTRGGQTAFVLLTFLQQLSTSSKSMTSLQISQLQQAAMGHTLTLVLMVASYGYWSYTLIVHCTSSFACSIATSCHCDI